MRTFSKILAVCLLVAVYSALANSLSNAAESIPIYTKLDETGAALPESATSWAMVRDNITGLIWEAKEAGDGIQDYSNPHDADNIYTWCDTDPDTNGGVQGCCGAADTENFLTSLNSGAGFAGYTDWRLPTIEELEALSNHGLSCPAINTIYFPLTVLSGYWTSTTYAGNTSYAWFTHFYLGNSDSYNKSNSYFVRAVHGTGIQPENRFVDNHNGTVTDTVTCLQWQQASADMTGDGYPDLVNWQNALDYAANLSFAGHDDWRLPGIDELITILDYTHYKPAIEDTIFPVTESYYYWSSTNYSDSPDRAWCVYFGNGYDSGRLQNYSHYVRTVRGQRCGSAAPAAHHCTIPIYLLLHGSK